MVCKPCPATGPLGQIPVLSADGDCQQSRTVAGGYMHKIQNVAGQSAHRLTMPIFTQRIRPQSEVRPAGSEDAVAPPGTVIVFHHVCDQLPATSCPCLYRPLHHELHGYEHFATLPARRAHAASSAIPVSSQRYIPHCSAVHRKARHKAPAQRCRQEVLRWCPFSRTRGGPLCVRIR
jgi:hypothetical protein